MWLDRGGEGLGLSQEFLFVFGVCGREKSGGGWLTVLAVGIDSRTGVTRSPSISRRAALHCMSPPVYVLRVSTVATSLLATSSLFLYYSGFSRFLILARSSG